MAEASTITTIRAIAQHLSGMSRSEVDAILAAAGATTRAPSDWIAYSAKAEKAFLVAKLQSEGTPIIDRLARIVDETDEPAGSDMDTVTAPKGRSSRPSLPTVPRVFIGSSTEGLSVARALQAELDHDFETTIWSQGIFGLSATALESLEAALRDFDYAVLVLTPDDLVTKRGEAAPAPRDNVVYEAGLFMGALGRHRTFLVSPRVSELALPSDLAGITLAQYRERTDGNLQAAVGPVATNIRVAIETERKRRARALQAASERQPDEGEVPALGSLATPAPDNVAPPTVTAGPDLARLLDSVDQLDEAFESGSDRAQLRGDEARLYGVVIRSVKAARPADPFVAALQEPQETAMSGIFSTTRGEARTGLNVLRSALVSAP
jgi:predicted nucleotide-binding protein